MAGGKIPIGSRDAAGACGAPAAMIPRGPLPRDILYSIGRVKRECRRVRKAAFGNGDRGEGVGVSVAGRQNCLDDYFIAGGTRCDSAARPLASGLLVLRNASGEGV